jgi:hypothetical protein
VYAIAYVLINRRDYLFLINSLIVFFLVVSVA